MVAYYDDPTHFADLMNDWICRGTKQLMAEQILEAVYGKEPEIIVPGTEILPSKFKIFVFYWLLERKFKHM